MKSTDNLTPTKDKQFLVLDVSKRDLELWCSSDVPVILALYDAQREIAYYVDIVEYFRKDGVNLEKIRKFVWIKMPLNNIFTTEVITKLRHIKNQIN